MIKLSENKIALKNLRVTLDALEELEDLITYYADRPGLADLKVKNVLREPEIQIDHKIFIVALKAQRQSLIDYLSTLGIEVDELSND